MSGEFENEEKLASVIVDYLKDFEWEVYQEVQLGDGGPIIDIVGTRGPLLRVVECKLSLSTALLEQAIRISPWAHYTHVATPSLRTRKGHHACKTLLRYEGIGYLTARGSYYEEDVYTIREDVPPLFRRTAVTECIRRHLNEKQKTWAPAGNATGSRYTPFRDTCERWKRFVKNNPGCTLKQVVEHEKHHYSSDSTAKTVMVKWILSGVVRGIVIKEGKPLKLYPSEEKDMERRKCKGKGGKKGGRKGK